MTRVGTLVAALLVSAAGCTGPLMQIAPEPPAGYVTTSRAKGSACGFTLFGLIPISLNDRAGRAYWEAQKASGGSGLTDVTVTDRWYYAVIGGLYCTDVEGIGYKTP